MVDHPGQRHREHALVILEPYQLELLETLILGVNGPVDRIEIGRRPERRVERVTGL